MFKKIWYINLYINLRRTYISFLFVFPETFLVGTTLSFNAEQNQTVGSVYLYLFICEVYALFTKRVKIFKNLSHACVVHTA